MRKKRIKKLPKIFFETKKTFPDLVLPCPTFWGPVGKTAYGFLMDSRKEKISKRIRIFI